MSDEQRKDETEVESHRWRVGANEEPAEEAADEGETEVEAHIRFTNVRMD